MLPPRRSFADYLSSKKEEYGSKFDSSDLAVQFIPYYENQIRIQVSNPSGYVRRGRVSVTTGWKPSFLLMHRISDIGSADLLGKEDLVIREVSI